MELERPHRQAPSTTSDLFICFSSMRLSSKSMVSPGRTDKPPISLSASLSRRLRSKSKNGSLKGGQSPMFPPGMSNKKRGGCATIDNNNNPEPSSPKVTCIGQVRVKTKKHGKKMKMNMSRAYRARRSGSSGGDLRGEGDGCLHHRNQRWVHLPVTICDALRGFGSEFNCFSPCKPSCFSGSEVKESRGRGSKRSSCCGSVCRWLVAPHEGERERRDIELVVGKEEDRGVDRVMERECSRRRSIFDDVDFNIDEICEAGNEIGGEVEGDEEEEEAARVSICVPPKNALLLMRCRSDPVKMKALSSRFWESPPKNQHRDDDEEEDRAVEEIGRRRSSVSERVKVESLSFFAEEETGRRSSVNERARVESLSSFAEEEAGRRKSSVSERIKVESSPSYAEEETGKRRSSFSERIKVESLSNFAEEETGRRRSSVSERVKVESLSNYAEETERRRSSFSERVKVEPLSSYAEEEAGRRRSSVSERVKFESLSNYAEEETGRRRSSFNERGKVESLSSCAEEETGRRRSSVSERVKIEALSSYAKETGRRRSSVSERVKIESLSTSVEEEKGESPQNTETQLEVSSEEHLQGVGTEMDGELIQEEKLQKRRFSIDSKDQVEDLGVFVEDPDGKEKEAIEVVVPSGQSTDPLESAPPLEEDKGEKVGEKVSSFEQSEEDIQPQPLKEDELETERSEQQPLEEASEDDDSMEEANMQEESGLPDCLLLMMCEPKVSMEVSKETWVCSTDFLRWLPERHRQHHLKATTTKKKKKNKTNTTESNPPPPARLPEAARLPPQPQGFQPPRSSCSFPIGGGVSTVGVVKEKKLVSALAYEPFVLTRCKSEPMRSATAKLAPAPELACSWKNRKIEPHRPAACGVGAAGLGC